MAGLHISVDILRNIIMSHGGAEIHLGSGGKKLFTYINLISSYLKLKTKRVVNIIDK